MGRQAQSEGFRRGGFDRLSLSGCGALIHLLHPLRLSAELVEVSKPLAQTHPAANPDTTPMEKHKRRADRRWGLNRTGLAGAHLVRMADEQRAGVSSARS